MARFILIAFLITLAVAPQPAFDVARCGRVDIMPVLITGLQEELGLKLESKKMPLDLLIIGHPEKVPVEN
jgi:uncharacterized protein (TIGR03435 family)